MNDTIQYAVDSDGIALLTIDLPGKPMNVLTPELMSDLEETVARAAAEVGSGRSPQQSGIQFRVVQCGFQVDR